MATSSLRRLVGIPSSATRLSRRPCADLCAWHSSASGHTPFGSPAASKIGNKSIHWKAARRTHAVAVHYSRPPPDVIGPYMSIQDTCHNLPISHGPYMNCLGHKSRSLSRTCVGEAVQSRRQPDFASPSVGRVIRRRCAGRSGTVSPVFPRSSGVSRDVCADQTRER